MRVFFRTLLRNQLIRCPPPAPLPAVVEDQPLLQLSSGDVEDVISGEEGSLVEYSVDSDDGVSVVSCSSGLSVVDPVTVMPVDPLLLNDGYGADISDAEDLLGSLGSLKRSCTDCKFPTNFLFCGPCYRQRTGIFFLYVWAMTLF